MRQIETTTEIDADPAQVWNVLADLDSYAEWNPFITQARGEVREGERLTLRFRPPGGSAMTMRPRVLTAEPSRELRWLGRLGVRGIFDGEHYFRLERLDGNRTRLIHGERFTGFTVPLFGGVLRKTERGFGHLNEALKQRCEATVA